MNLAAVRWTLWGLLGVVLLVTAVGVRLADRTVTEDPGAPPVLGEVGTFELVNRDGRVVTLEDLRGKVWVANFIFTRCALSCPRMTSQMLRLGEEMPRGVAVTRVSVSVDPAYDSPEVLDRYAASYSVDDPEWLFVTGEPDVVERLVIDGFKLPIVRDAPPEAVDPREPILHSDRMVLVDRDGRIRGYYQPQEGGELARLRSDILQVAEEPVVQLSGDELAALCRREVEGLHRFFVDWYIGALPRTAAPLARLSGALGEEFVRIGPDGGEMDRGEVLGAVDAAHGSRTASAFEIRIEAVRHRPSPEGHCLLTYQEWQRSGDSTTARLSSALFRARRSAPGGVEWLHLHETWLPEVAGQ